MSSHARILFLIGSLALVASLTIVIAFVVTDAERARIQLREVRSGELQAEGDDLVAAVRDQQEAIDDYLISDEPDLLDGYHEAVAEEARLTGLIRPEVSDTSLIRTSLDALEEATTSWRELFAEPAIEAVTSGSADQLAKLKVQAAHDQDAAQAESGELIEQLDAVDADLRSETNNLNMARTLAIGLGVAFQILAALASLLFVRRYGLRLEREAAESSVLNRFTELTTFAVDDDAVARSNLEAIRLLVGPDAAITHVLNRSKDRALPAASYGARTPEILPLNAISGCPGIVRGSVYVTDDAAAPLSVHCPIYPADRGTVACVPLAHGDNVGAIHLAWNAPHAFPLEHRAGVARIAEHAALAIGNRRLLAALQGQANTDPRTGLQNSRAFDRALEEALAALGSQQGAAAGAAVLMLDLDHFKDVNDRHGHPAGDEALRAFASVLRSCMRDGDLAARYGGEEFAVLLSNVDPGTALSVAERIRSRTEATLISLGPGVTERLTVSIGVAAAPQQALERISLLRLADAALYDAKQSGRNRVRYAGDADPNGVDSARRLAVIAEDDGAPPASAADVVVPGATASGAAATRRSEAG